MDWQNKDEVMNVCAIGEMAQILIKAMNWEKEYKQYKNRMYAYLKDSKQKKHQLE